MNTNKADIVLSDAVPEFIGEKFVDHINAWDLNYVVLNTMKKLLKKGGRALIKVMRGPCIEEVIDAYLAHFESVIKVKPSASRHESNEMYLLWTGYGQSQHEFTKKVEKKETEVQNLKTSEDVDKYENEINEESRQMAEEFLADLKK